MLTLRTRLQTQRQQYTVGALLRLRHVALPALPLNFISCSCLLLPHLSPTSAASTWEQGECPQIFKCWDDLNDEERRAAQELGYCAVLWDAEDKSRATGCLLCACR